MLVEIHVSPSLPAGGHFSVMYYFPSYVLLILVLPEGILLYVLFIYVAGTLKVL